MSLFLTFQTTAHSIKPLNENVSCKTKSWNWTQLRTYIYIYMGPGVVVKALRY